MLTVVERHRATREFISAGNATFTIETPEQRWTFRFRRVEDEGRKPITFVNLLTGPDNEADYTYVGVFDTFTEQVKTTRASKFAQDSLMVRALNRVLLRVWQNDHETMEAHGWRIYHEGKCGRCGRTLTVPESIKSGFGPECVKHQ